MCSHSKSKNVIIQTEQFSGFCRVDNGHQLKRMKVGNGEKKCNIKFNPLIRSGKCDRSIPNKFHLIHILLHSLQCCYILNGIVSVMKDSMVKPNYGQL